MRGTISLLLIAGLSFAWPAYAGSAATGQQIDKALSAQGRVLGAASLIRCGLSVLKDGKLVTSGTIIELLPVP